MPKELFRIRYEDYLYLVTTTKIADADVPKALVNLGIDPLWIAIYLTKKSTSKTRGKYNKDAFLDTRCTSEPTKDSYLILKKIITEFEKWLNKERPKAFIINAYKDKHEKRMKLYNRILGKHGYHLISYYMGSIDYDYNEYYYAREDLGIKKINLPF